MVLVSCGEFSDLAAKELAARYGENAAVLPAPASPRAILMRAASGVIERAALVPGLTGRGGVYE